MAATIIDGKVVADKMRDEIKAQSEAFAEKHGYPPGLGVVLVGDDPASQMYVRMKRRACKRVGIHSVAHLMPESSTQEEVLARVRELNADPQIHGILVQLPLPKHVDEEVILREVALDKDVDGFHPVNIGALAMKGREPSFTPATPTGVMALLDDLGTPLEGANAVIVGRSNIVGMPVSLMLLKRNATVTVCHSRTRNTREIVSTADVLIVAAGVPEYVKGDWIKPGAVVIDVGTNKIEDPEAEKGYRWVGDVDFEAAKEVAGAITLVPGGVGPMTITMLLYNTLKSARRSVGELE
jgi:5,10-methylene-tetrahydrofolate dehydrogenase/methenyl tetrahydrofolate cyclohydrolase